MYNTLCERERDVGDSLLRSERDPSARNFLERFLKMSHAACVDSLLTTTSATKPWYLQSQQIANENPSRSFVSACVEFQSRHLGNGTLCEHGSVCPAADRWSTFWEIPLDPFILSGLVVLFPQTWLKFRRHHENPFLLPSLFQRPLSSQNKNANSRPNKSIHS